MEQRSKPEEDSIRILHLVGGKDSRGGIMTYVRELSIHSDRKVQNLVWKHRGYPPENGCFVSRGVAQQTDASICGDLVAALLDFFPLLFWSRKNRPAVLHAHSRMGVILSALVCKLLRTPVVVHVHARYKRPWFHHLLWRWTKAKVIFNSRGTCLHYGRPVECSSVLTPPMRWPTQALGNGSRPRFVACGAFVAVKNVHSIIEAFALLPPQADHGLRVYGLSRNPIQPSYQQHVINLARKHPAVELREWDSDWKRQLRRQDIFVHAGSAEAFGIVILEAFALGCRLVVPHGTFLDDLPEPYCSAGVFKTDLSPANFAAQLASAQDSDPEDLFELRKKIAPAFAIENTIRTLSDLYESMLKEKNWLCHNR